jgi:D-arginine dehydrogenase
MSHSCDILIIGGGIAGLSLASTLSADAKVVLAEAEPALAYHTSSRSARQLVPSYGPAVVRALTDRTLVLLHRIQEQTGHRFLTPRSFLLIGAEEAVRAHASEGMEFLSPAEAGRLSPELRPDTFEAAGLDRRSFGSDADAMIEYHRSTAVANGAVVLTGAPVRSATAGPGRWRVEAGPERIEAATVVNAAGAWADAVAGLFGAAPQGLVPYRRTAAVVDVAHPLGAGQPMVAAADDTFYYRPEGSQVLISPSERVASPAEDARPRPGDVEAVVGLIDRMTTMEIRSVARSWTGLRTEPADGHPVVGFDAAVAGFFWLAGQGGYGFQTSCGIAELAAALLGGREPGAGTGSAAAALSPLRNTP